MRLSGRGVRCVRGGREVFSGLDFDSRLRRGAGRHRPQRIRQDLAAAADRGPAVDGRRIDRSRGRRGGTDAARTGPLSRPSRRAEAGAERAGEPVILAGFSRRRRRRMPAQSLAASWGSIMPRICRRPICRRDSGDGSRSPGCWPCHGRSGCWTSRPRRSMPPDKTCLPTLMRDHLARGGLIVAATHVPLGVPAHGAADRRRVHDRAWRPDSPGHPDRAARRRRRADRRAVLSHRGGADAVRDRTRSGAAGAAWSGDSLARRAAREPAHPRPAVHGRP